MSLPCYPKCVFPLPQVTARISTAFSMCIHPPEFQATIRHDVASTSVFKAQWPVVQDIRSIGTEHWPLKLDVDFHPVPSDKFPDLYSIKACIVTERTNTMGCFLNSTFRASEMEDCAGARGSSTPIFLLSVLLAIFFMTVTIGIVVIVHRLYSRYNQFRRKRAHKYSKPQNCAQLLPSQNSQKFDIEDDRLTVIEEERESEDDEERSENEFDAHSVHITPCDRRDSSSSGFGSEHEVHDEVNVPSLFPPNVLRPPSKTMTMVNTHIRTPFQAFRPLAQEV